MRNLLQATADGKRLILGSPGTDYSLPHGTAVAAVALYDPADEEGGELTYLTVENLEQIRLWIDENFPREFVLLRD